MIKCVSFATTSIILSDISKMSNKKKGIIAGIILLAIIGYFSFSDEDAQEKLFGTIEEGKMEVLVVTSGELEAINSVEINGPKSMRSVGIYNAQISELVPEGTMVEKGDLVAKIDPSELSGKLSQALDELNKAKSKYLQSKLDTALNLSKNRETIKDLKYAVEERKIEMEQSKYEPPATVRLAEMEYEKSKEKLIKEKANYDLNFQKATAEMQEAAADLNIAQSNVDRYEKVLEEFIILAPEGGMIIYTKTWDGKKVTSGSTITPWNSTVAKLPDLSEMISKTYVNEVDIRKVKVGQKVQVSLDAFPEKALTGEVIEVANMGETISGSDAKVFAVTIKLDQVDEDIRPGMTTGNKIITYEKEQTTLMPLEALFMHEDSIPCAFVKKGMGFEKQRLKIGQTNENFVELDAGLKVGDEVYLNQPEEAKDMALTPIAE